MIGLVDANNFYVSCERVFDLSLAKKPVAVLSNNDGCVVSRSQEFKNLGISMGTPYFQLRDRERTGELIFRSSNYELYGNMSQRIIEVLGTFTPDVEQYSIDEAFVHFTRRDNPDYFELGTAIRSRVLKWVGIPCGVGFAPSRTLAKIANHIGKKRPEGVFVMPADPRPVLEELPAEEVWGIGRRLALKLASDGILSAWQLAATDTSWLQKHYNVNVARTALELRGTSALTRENYGAVTHSVSVSRSFSTPVTELPDLEESVAFYVAQSCEKLRKSKLVASGINVYYQLMQQQGEDPWEGGYAAATITFPSGTANASTIMHALRPKLKALFVKGKRYRKSGVVLFGLEDASNMQLDLFAPPPEDDKLSAAVDSINRKFGRGKVFMLSEGISRNWSMKRTLLSPSYTTKWDQILKVK